MIALIDKVIPSFENPHEIRRAEEMGYAEEAPIGYLVLFPFFSDFVFGILFASVGGIMVFVSLDELLPAAREYGEHHLSIYSLVIGMIVMALSLILFL